PLLLADPLEGLIPSTIQLQLLLGGFGLLMAQVRFPGGVTAAQRRILQRFLDRRAPATGDSAVAPAAQVEVPTGDRAVGAHRRDGVALSVRGVRVAFDGVAAVDNVALEVSAGEIVGVIGANGAGKTTLLDAICGLTRADGTVTLFGRDVSGLAPDQRAQEGMSRGFQDARLFPALSVRETIELALDRRHPVGRFGTLVAAPWTRLAERSVAADAATIIERFGLLPYADVPGDRLSTGTRHICDLAAQAATQPRIMILDEPTSGIAQREAEAFGPLLRDLVGELGCAMLVVEHDMPFLMSVADRIYCLERGRVIAEGAPAAVRKDPAVVASYLGAARARTARRSTR
ncbi:MAG TPA: ATP-binding cassette domain-containing protein, partial [Acidimicrobiales bacterium]|nr:ATP-binding cassette domain-containing protein [Acidimicrobiales bacterium]